MVNAAISAFAQKNGNLIRSYSKLNMQTLRQSTLDAHHCTCVTRMKPVATSCNALTPLSREINIRSITCECKTQLVEVDLASRNKKLTFNLKCLVRAAATYQTRDTPINSDIEGYWGPLT